MITSIHIIYNNACVTRHSTAVTGKDSNYCEHAQYIIICMTLYVQVIGLSHKHIDYCSKLCDATQDQLQ